MRSTSQLRGGVGIVLQAVLVGLGGQQLHADQLIQYLILLLGSQLLLLALQQVLHIDVVFGARYRRTVDDGHGRRHRLVRARAGRAPPPAVSCRRPSSMATAATVDTTVHGVRKNWLIGILYAKKRLWPTWPVRPGAAVYDNSRTVG